MGHITTLSLTTKCGVAFTADSLLGASPLTACCKAAEGGSDRPRCKACGKPVSGKYGTSGYHAMLWAAEQAGCPCPSACASEAVWLAEQLRG